MTKLLWVIVLLLAGCSTGRLYTHIVEPYSVDFDRTPVGTKSCVVNRYRIAEPISGYDVSAEWDTDVFAQTAREAGITNIYYTDRETLSIGFGVFRRRQLIIYGD